MGGRKLGQAGHVGAVFRDFTSALRQELVPSFRATVGLRAAAVCIDVRVIPPGETDKTDAICVRLEHCEGQSVVVYLPYRKGPSGGYAYGEIFAAPGESTIFAS